MESDMGHENEAEINFFFNIRFEPKMTKTTICTLSMSKSIIFYQANYPSIFCGKNQSLA